MSAAIIRKSGLIVRQMRDQGLQDRADGGRCSGRQGVRLDHRTGRRRHAVHLRPRPAQQADRESHRRAFQGQEHRSRRLHALHLRRDAGLVAGGREGRHDRSEESHGGHQGWRLGYRARQDGVRRQGRHQADRLCRLQVGRQGQLRRDQSRGIKKH